MRLEGALLQGFLSKLMIVHQYLVAFVFLTLLLAEEMQVSEQFR
ncbi:hypothetical protein [Streptococcus suis]|nr:hypothetical protein [Streptococcus suis]